MWLSKTFDIQPDHWWTLLLLGAMCLSVVAIVLFWPWGEKLTNIRSNRIGIVTLIFFGIVFLGAGVVAMMQTFEQRRLARADMRASTVIASPQFTVTVERAPNEGARQAVQDH